MLRIWLFFALIVMIGCAADPPPQVDDRGSVDNPETCREHCFDRGAAADSFLRAADDIAICSKPKEPQGFGHVTVTFAPDGHALSAVLDQPAFDADSSKGCIEAIFARITVPPFEGEPVKIGKSFPLEKPRAVSP